MRMTWFTLEPGLLTGGPPAIESTASIPGNTQSDKKKKKNKSKAKKNGVSGMDNSAAKGTENGVRSNKIPSDTKLRVNGIVVRAKTEKATIIPITQEPLLPTNNSQGGGEAAEVYEGISKSSLRALLPRFRKLHKEGKTASYVNKARRFKFLRLPTEVRVMVYKNLLLNEPIDFWPITGKYHDPRIEGENAVDNAQLRTRTVKALQHGQIIRVSKQLCQEASPFLYGGNEFRFTGPNGWVVFAFFLHTIGNRAREQLKHVQICGPRWGPEGGPISCCDITYYDALMCRKQEAQFLDAIAGYGFKIPRQFMKYNAKFYAERAFGDCLKWLSLSHALTKVEILVPSWWGTGEYTSEKMGDDDQWMKRLMGFKKGHPNLKFSLVRLRREASEDIEHEWTSEAPDVENNRQLRVFEQALKFKNDWTVKDAVLRDDGNYKVVGANEWWKRDGIQRKLKTA